MSIEEDQNDELYRLLVGNVDPSDEKLNKRAHSYINRLTGLSLPELLQESTQLKEEQEKAKRDAQKLAFSNYPSFLRSRTCANQLSHSFKEIDTSLEDFSACIKDFQATCDVFTKEAKVIKKESNKIACVLENEDALTELLEIPQLMETCVWNGYYSEVMDLASHVRLLSVRYPLSVISSIQQQVQTCFDLMLIQLLSHLRKPIRLAAAMNAVGFLRRMDIFESENELRMVFLRCRHDFLQQKLIRIKRDMSEDPKQRSQNASEYLKKFIDVIREQMFEIGTQYIWIFPHEQGPLLSDYMVNLIEDIRMTLNIYLPMVEDESSKSSLLTQFEYCSMSLGRIGLDFRHLFTE
ncbi:oligomeric Golgi complex subunit 8 [Sporodiniella umbellata]|nr:oligomeric Golgi complex subunit 8 [Sporodiniella umbellata]